jgi:hypothetical protein
MKSLLTLPASAFVFASMGAGAVIAYRVTQPLPAAVSCRAGASTMERLELLFGAGRRNASEVSDTEWQSFLDAEVTPRFQDGLTVLTGYGQWRNREGTIAKETSRMLIIWHRPAGDSDARIDAIRAAYKARFGQESVLRADGTSCVSF